MKAEFDALGKSKMEFLKHTEGKVIDFVDKYGDQVDPFGDEEKKDKDEINMNSAEAFNHTFLYKVDAMGTEMAKTKAQRGEIDDKSYHFAVGEVDACGNDAGKKASGQTTKRK